MPLLKRPDNVYYGWYIIIVLAITETISWGIIFYSFSVFITPIEADLGWSRAQLTGGFSLSLLITGAMAYPVGYWIDRHGARLLMTVGSIVASILVIAWSQVTDVTTFYFIWAGLGVCSAAILYEPAFTVIAAWFVRKRSTAFAVVTFAAGLASTIFLPLSDALLNWVGWRDAVLLLGTFLAVTTIPLHAIFLRRRPDDLGLLPDGEIIESTQSLPSFRNISVGTALSSRPFWLLTLAFSLSALAISAIRVHFIPLLIDVGINPSAAALASGSIGIMQVAGRIVFAPLDSRFSSWSMVGGVFALQAVAISILIFGLSGGILIGIFIILFGAAVGANTLARPSVLAELYGSSHYGRISSVMAIFLRIAGTVAPFGAGLLYDSMGSYDLIIWIVALLSFVAVGIMVFVKPQTRMQTA